MTEEDAESRWTALGIHRCHSLDILAVTLRLDYGEYCPTGDTIIDALILLLFSFVEVVSGHPLSLLQPSTFKFRISLVNVTGDSVPQLARIFESGLNWERVAASVGALKSLKVLQFEITEEGTYEISEDSRKRAYDIILDRLGDRLSSKIACICT